jgi:hypothetical protein
MPLPGTKLYKSILHVQPADGQVVYIRRYSAEPPALATWDLPNQRFALVASLNLTITGGTFTGVWPLAYTSNVGGSGLPAYYHLESGIYLAVVENSPGTWHLQETDAVANAYYDATGRPTPDNNTASTFTTIGAPTWTPPTHMATGPFTPAALLIPAYAVETWRPQ